MTDFNEDLRQALTQAHVRESDLAVALQAANRDLTQAQARIRELETVLREMTTVLHSVVTTETFAPPRDVPANTHWQAAGFWIGKARGLLEGRVATGLIWSREDRAVLDACAKMALNDDDTDADPLEPQEHGENCYIYTDDQRDIAKAELARRAAGKGE